ncbi:MAG TPA: hypothetical protein VFA20_04400 [Myxococcaceae bacterium]|nr:hypothetical protein [Myxococcaceae bacterium]
MWTLAQDVLNAAKGMGVAASALALEESAVVHRDLAARYGRAAGRWPLWDGRAEYPAIQDAAAWRLIAEFVHDDPCLLLWDPATDRTVIRFERGRDVVQVLGDVHRSEFYVTDPALSLMLCFNHHDFLIAAGRAAKWLEVRRSQGQT